ncbi:MAG: sugar ABC transporter permease [Spirochaetota bacterium]|nr:sugar ABC transporter permease [Spirochaetota bacterium]
MRKKGSRLLEGLLFISPYLVLWLLFLFGPLLFGFFMSLHVWDPLGENKFIGLGNYLHLFRNARFWNSFLTTWKFVGMVIPGIIISALLVALLLHFVKFKGSAVFESLFFFPYLLNVSIVSIMWALLNDPDIGLISLTFEKILNKKTALLADERFVLPIIAIATIWWLVGYRMIVFRAALSSIPEEMFDAAKIDGAGAMRTFFAVTLPLMKPTLLFALILTAVGGMRTFGQVILMTNGGPGTSSEVLALLMYRQGFEFLNFGRAAAIGFILFMLIFLISTLLVKFFKLEGDLR